MKEEATEKRVRATRHPLPFYRGVAQEAPFAYKNVTTVVNVAEKAGLSRKIARLSPITCVMG